MSSDRGEITSWSRLTEEYDIPASYNNGALEDAVREAEAVEMDIATELQVRGRNGDLRDLTTFTIDPDDAKDYDDALSIREEGDGYRAWVHIADVSHYVKPEGFYGDDPDRPVGALDDAARERGVTFYLGENTRHMLPEELSTDICSLVPDEERLAHTVEMRLGEDGTVQDYDVYKSVIESDARLSYSGADAILDGEVGREYGEDIREDLEMFDALTQRMRTDRWDTSLIINPRESPSSRLIEEMMITANVAVGQYLQEHGLPGIYRVEDDPVTDWTSEVEEDLADAGYTLPEGWDGTPKASLNTFFAEDVEPDNVDEAKKAVVTKLPRARYAAHSRPHFALGLEDYVHFTSPIRRYADLMVHRIISGEFDGRRQDLIYTADTVSRQESEAKDAERDWR